jgi:rRNA maturation RNase YbeY
LIKDLAVYNKHKIGLSARQIHKLIKSLKTELGFVIESLSISFIPSDEVYKINKEYLNHDYYTDIITFNYSGNNNNLDGEIIISNEDAINNSIRYKVTIEEEVTRLVIHGILHLIGYNDIEMNEKYKMKKTENYLTKKYSINLNGK